MKLPADAHIAPGKLSRYLLVKRSVGDKSEFLKRAGYTLQNAQRLERDIRTQILTKDAVVTKRTIYGQHYEIRAPLTGQELQTGITNFITLYPDKGERHEI
jgi:hypothetical protein